MQQIQASQVRALREQTGAGIMDCKQALAAAQGDTAKAVEHLRRKGLAASAKKASRIASEGAVGAYIHGAGKIGVMVEINSETDFVGRNEDFQKFVRDVAMHIAAAAPVYVRREEADETVLDKERAFITSQVEEEAQKAGGKPPAVLEKMIGGRVEKYLGQICLLEQAYVKDPSQTVGQVLSELVAKIGEKVEVRRFTRYQLGEGLAKRTENFAEEVKKAAAGG